MSDAKRVLIVEKNAKEAEPMVRFLKAKGFLVHVETSAVRTLAIVDKQKFDFAFIECELEGIPGPDLAYQLKIKDRDMQIALIVSRRYDPEWVLRALRKARLTQHFQKPIEDRDMLNYFAKHKMNFEQIGAGPSSAPASAPKAEEPTGRTSKHVRKFTREELEQQIEKYRVELKGRNHFEMLGITKDFTLPEIKRVFREISKIYHPDLLESWLKPELLPVARDIFTNMTTAYSVLSDAKRRFKYEHELEHGTAQGALTADALISQGVAFLKQNNFTAALNKFESAALESVMTDELNIYCLWAQMEMMGMEQAPDDVRKQIFDALNKLRLKKLDSPEYHYVWGMYHYINNDKINALKSFQEAVVRKPNFVEAQRKVQIIIVSQPINDAANKNRLANMFKIRRSS